MSTSVMPGMGFWQRAKLPVMISGERAECALVCVAMVAGYWGYRIDLQSMRARYSVSLKGANLKTVLAVGAGLNLKGRPLKAPLSKLETLNLPCILHWEMEHFVVLKKVSKGYATIHDPAVGERRLPMDQVSKFYTGVAVEFTPDAGFKKGEERKRFSLLSLAGRVIGLKEGLAQLLLLGLALQVCVVAAPFYLQWVVDEAIVSGDRSLMTALGLGFLLLVAIQAAIGCTRTWAVARLSASFNFQWLSNAFGHLMSLPLGYFERRHVGDIVSRFGSIQHIQRTLSTQLVEGVLDGLLAIVTLTVMLIYSVKLTMVCLVVVALYLGLRTALIPKLTEAAGEQVTHDAKQQTHFLESARGIQAIRLFGKAEERRVGWLNMLADRTQAELQLARLTVVHSTAQTVLFGVERVVIIWLAATAVMDSVFSLGMMFAFVTYKEQFTARVVSLIDKVMDISVLRMHADRVADVVLAEPEGGEDFPEVDTEAVEPSIELRGVSFRYGDVEPFVLKDVNLRIEAGENVAITGSSGSGKTTLLKIMMGLIQPTSGQVLIGGKPMGALGLANYRRMVGCVMQEDTVFSGSIFDNISFFDHEFSAERVALAAGMAAIRGEIEAMPMGYHTILGDNGAGVSGGQKQRLLLARALYRNPRILVLDEATSHLDIANEQQVNEAIKRCNVTRIVVAHRPETIRSAERILVLQDGVIECITPKSDAAAKVASTAGLSLVGEEAGHRASPAA